MAYYYRNEMSCCLNISDQQDGRAGMASITLAPDEDVTPENLTELFRHCSDLLPVYAIPRFLRVQEEMGVTATFKQRKVELVQEGFDPSKCGGEPLYCVDFSQKTYIPLVGTVYNKIVDCDIRL